MVYFSMFLFVTFICPVHFCSLISYISLNKVSLQRIFCIFTNGVKSLASTSFPVYCGNVDIYFVSKYLYCYFYFSQLTLEQFSNNKQMTFMLTDMFMYSITSHLMKKIFFFLKTIFYYFIVICIFCQNSILFKLFLCIAVFRLFF